MVFGWLGDGDWKAEIEKGSRLKGAMTAGTAVTTRTTGGARINMEAARANAREARKAKSGRNSWDSVESEEHKDSKKGTKAGWIRAEHCQEPAPCLRAALRADEVSRQRGEESRQRGIRTVRRRICRSLVGHPQQR